MLKPPGLPGAKPIIGHILQFRKNPLKFFVRSHDELGDIAWLQSPFRDVTLVFKPDYIRYILQENNKAFRKSFGYDELKILLGEGLLTSEGETWKKQRRLAQPAFHKERIAYLVSIMGDVVLDTVTAWKQQFKNGDEVNITFEMNKLALEIVSRTLFQTDVSAREIEELNHALGVVIEVGAQRIRDPFQPPRWVPTKANRESKKAVLKIREIVSKIIEKRVGSTERFDDLLDMLVHTTDEETGEKMTMAALMDEVMTIYIAGHETTANALAFTWYLLAKNPKEKEKLFAEIQGLGVEKPAMHQLKELKFSRMVVDESLRLYPPAWIIGRQGLHEEKMGDYTLPKFCTYGIPVYVVHRSPAYWKNPEDFIPERFNEENGVTIPKFAYFPFGGGPRLCIGQMFAIYEMQIALYVLWKHIDFELDPNYQLEIEPLITLRTRKPILMKIKIK
jgi:cytochrome P450